MKSILSLLIIVGLSTQILLAEEIVQTVDGRRILLNDDGTFEILSSAPADSDNFLEVTDHFLERHTDRYSQNSIRFMPIFRNKSSSVITAVRFTTTFLDPFGSEILKIAGKTEERLPSGSLSSTNLFYSFVDNPFLPNERYDKLLSLALNGTGSIRTDVTALVFDTGEILQFGNSKDDI